jgi:S-formylglutathione hydrolase FrmB
MAVNSFDADVYIKGNVIDIDDWLDADASKKDRILKVAETTLTRKYSKYIVPDNAVYEFAAVLATAFNDTNRLNNQGIAGFSITGVGSFNFKDTQRRDIEAFIPQSSLSLIGEANGVKLSGRRVGWSVI